MFYPQNGSMAKGSKRTSPTVPAAAAVFSEDMIDPRKTPCSQSRASVTSGHFMAPCGRRRGWPEIRARRLGVSSSGERKGTVDAGGEAGVGVGGRLHRATSPRPSSRRGGRQGVAVVKVGAATETEMKEKRHRVEDALQATRAALEEGIVPGGGVALLRASDAVKPDAYEDDDERTGARIVLRALEEPLRQISENAGLEGSVVVNDVRKAKKGQGLNAATGQIVDLVAEGIIDPAMVTRSALQNAASIAKNILTTEAIVAEVPEKDGGGGMGGGMPDMAG